MSEEIRALRLLAECINTLADHTLDYERHYQARSCINERLVAVLEMSKVAPADKAPAQEIAPNKIPVRCPETPEGCVWCRDRPLNALPDSILTPNGCDTCPFRWQDERIHCFLARHPLPLAFQRGHYDRFNVKDAPTRPDWCPLDRQAYVRVQIKPKKEK